MRKRAQQLFVRFGAVALQAIGMIVLSQGMSFARFNEFATAQENHNLHAWLIALLGVAVLILGILIHHILERLPAHPQGAEDVKAQSGTESRSNA